MVRRCHNHLDCSSSLFPRYIYFLPTVRNQNEGSSKEQEEQEGEGTTDEAAERERRRLHIPAKPVQSTEQDFYIVGSIREGHASPTEHDAMFSFQLDLMKDQKLPKVHVVVLFLAKYNMEVARSLVTLVQPRQKDRRTKIPKSL